MTGPARRREKVSWNVGRRCRGAERKENDAAHGGATTERAKREEAKAMVYAARESSHSSVPMTSSSAFIPDVTSGAMRVSPEEFDVVVVGTGLQEALIAR